MLRYQAPAVQKAFLVLKTVAESQDGMGVSKISEHLGLSKSTTHGLIQALLKVGALDQSPHEKKLYLGTSFMELAHKNSVHFNVAGELQPHLSLLCHKIGQTVFLGMLNHDKGTILATAKAMRSLSISSSPGTTFPLSAGAVGKVFLSTLSNEKVLKFLRKKGLKKYTLQTIVDETAYIKELEAVRRNGYALDNEEYMSGFRAVAMNPVYFRGLPMVIWVVGFVTTMTDEKLPEIIQNSLQTNEVIRSILKTNSMH